MGKRAEFESKIVNVSCLATIADHNTKISGVEGKIPDISKLFKTAD